MVKVKGISIRGLSVFVGLLILGVLACNTQSSTPAATRPPTNTPMPTNTLSPLEPTRTLTAPETLPAGVPPTFTPADTLTPLPTFTPFRPTLAATITPSNTPSNTPQFQLTLRATSTVRATGTITTEVPGPLTFTFEITWRLSSENPEKATATVAIHPKGGGGGYKYFLEGQLVGNPVEYDWVLCKGNPFNLIVESADGQRVSQNYFERPPCPTPTFTPTP
jgi:hypothetical protein